MESRKAVALCSKLYKTEEEQQIFLGFQILIQEQKKQATKQNVFGIFELQLKLKLSKLKLETKRKQMKRNNRNIFGLFVF